MLVSGRVIDRFTRRSKAAYAARPGGLADLAHSLLSRLRLGAGLAAGPGASSPAPMFLNYFYLSSSVALVQEEVRPDQRVLSGALLLLVMNFIGLGLGPDLCRRGERLFPRARHPDIRCRSRSTR